MKLLLPALFILCLIFSSCNHSSKEQQVVVSSTDSTAQSLTPTLPDSVIIKEPIVNTLRHYFSDTNNMDSFVIEMPAGNIMTNQLYVKIYDIQNNLLFIDSENATNLWSPEYFSQTTADPQFPAKALKRAIMAMFNVNNFNYAGEESAIKNASGNEVKNMIAWNEAVNDTDRIVYNYMLNPTVKNFVNYSVKLKRGVISVQMYLDED